MATKKLALNIVLIDANSLLTRSLSNILSRYDFIHIIQSFNSLLSFLKMTPPPEPDIIVLNVILPGINGTDLIKEIKQRHGSAKVVLLTSVTSLQNMHQALVNGANAYLSKDVNSEELVDALIAVNDGELYIGKSLRSKLWSPASGEEQFVYNLSPVEKKVIILVCKGKTIKEIANSMNLSVTTIQAYYDTVTKKLDLNNTVDLIMFAIQNGLYESVPE